MFKQFKRLFGQSWTYGIGHDLTPRERKTWVFFLYLLLANAAWYQLKDQARSYEEGEWSFLDYLMRKNEDEIDPRLTESFSKHSTTDLLLALREAQHKQDHLGVNNIIAVLNERGIESDRTLTTEEISDALSNATDYDVKVMRDVWAFTNYEDLDATERKIHNIVMGEYEKRHPAF